MKIWQWIRGLFSALKGFAVRSGFDKWLAEHWDDILLAVVREIRNGGGLSLHELQPRLFNVVKNLTGSPHDTWVSLAVGLAIETAKAKKAI